MQTDVTRRTNTTRVLDIIEWHCRQISIENGDYTDGVATDRINDPRKLLQDTTFDYRKYSALIRLKAGDETLLSGPKGNVGASARKVKEVELYCFQSLSDDQSRAGINCDQIQSWLQHDIEWRLFDDQQNSFDAAAVGLNTLPANTPWAPWTKNAMSVWGTKPDVLNMQLVKMIMGPTVHPKVSMVLKFQYQYEESSPRGQPGH